MAVQQLIVGGLSGLGEGLGNDLILRLRTATHWQVLRSPYRMRIFEAVRGSGGVCIRELADALHSSTTALYYHLDLLVRAGMIQSRLLGTEDGATQRGGRRPAVFTATGDRVVIEFDPSDELERRRVAAIARLWADESHAERFGGAQTEGEEAPASATTVPAEPSPLAIGVQAWEVLSEDEVAEIQESLNRVRNILASARARRAEDASDLRHATHHVSLALLPTQHPTLPSPSLDFRPGAGAGR
jgi:DNA-binding transcriptional ArsR family regulator